MAWFSKVLGGVAGFAVGGPVGAVLGVVIGSYIDNATERRRRGADSYDTQFYSSDYDDEIEMRQATFFGAFFSLLAKVAKADGRVSESEGEHFKNLVKRMQLSAQMQEFATATFNEAVRSNYSHRDFAIQLAQMLRGSGQYTLLSEFFYMLVSMASADGVLSPAEDTMLSDIAEIFGLGKEAVREAYSQFNINSDEHYYSILGVKPSASNDELRSAYRRLVKETHPDSLVQKGLPPELKAEAEKRFHLVQDAWERIKEQRNIA